MSLCRVLRCRTMTYLKYIITIGTKVSSHHMVVCFEGIKNLFYSWGGIVGAAVLNKP